MHLQTEMRKRQALSLAAALVPQEPSEDGCSFAFMLTNLHACLNHPAGARAMGKTLRSVQFAQSDHWLKVLIIVEYLSAIDEIAFTRRPETGKQDRTRQWGLRKSKCTISHCCKVKHNCCQAIAAGECITIRSVWSQD